MDSRLNVFMYACFDSLSLIHSGNSFLTFLIYFLLAVYENTVAKSYSYSLVLLFDFVVLDRIWILLYQFLIIADLLFVDIMKTCTCF